MARPQFGRPTCVSNVAQTADREEWKAKSWFRIVSHLTTSSGQLDLRKQYPRSMNDRTRNATAYWHRPSTMAASNHPRHRAGHNKSAPFNKVDPQFAIEAHMAASTFPTSPMDSSCIPSLEFKCPQTPFNSPTLDLVALAQAGDDDAFAELYVQNKRRVFSICLHIVRDFSLAEDLTQDIFLQVHRKIASFRGDAGFTSWLHRLAVNTVLMHLRKHTLPVVSIDNLATTGDEMRSERCFGTRDLAQAGAVDRLAINHAVARLRPGYRTIFLLHDVQGFDHGEIASMLKCSRGSTKSKLHKARKVLRGDLASQSRSNVAGAGQPSERFADLSDSDA